MRILLLAHSFNSLTQRLHVELRERGHELSVELDINDAVTREAVELFRPNIMLAPFLKRAIPEDIWRRYRCLIVHPGIIGDRGPSALDWAILEGKKAWGVTVLAGRGRDGCRAGLGRGGLHNARSLEIKPLSPRSRRRGGTGGAGGNRSYRTR